MEAILGPQNSPIDFMGLSGLPMKVNFIVGLTFLLYGPEHQADLQGGSVGWWPQQLPFLFFLFFLSWYLLLPKQLSEVDCEHLQRALNASRPLCSGTDTCLISHILLPETPAWIYTPGNCCIYGGLISPCFWISILVLSPVNQVLRYDCSVLLPAAVWLETT